MNNADKTFFTKAIALAYEMKNHNEDSFEDLVIDIGSKFMRISDEWLDSREEGITTVDFGKE